MRMWFKPGSNDGLRPDPPGEPLYTFNEIADKLGITPNQLRALRMRNPGMTACRSRKSTMSTGLHESRWRLSDAKKWFKSIAPSSNGDTIDHPNKENPDALQ